MDVSCAVSSCPNTLNKTGTKLRYYRFPTDESVRSVWTVRCDRRDSWDPATSYVCSSHFTNDDYMWLPHSPNTKKLHPDAVPSRHLLLFGWEVDEPRAETGSDLSDPEDSFDQSMVKTSAAGTSHLASQSGQQPIPTTSGYADSPETSEAEYSGTEESRPNALGKRRASGSDSGQPKTKMKMKDTYCAVLTCRAKKTTNFHYFPSTDKELSKKWIQAVYCGESHHRLINKKLFLCRRHFTEDDYLDPPPSGGARRLARGAVPSVNIPICRAEVRLARLKLHLDLNRRKAEERNLTFYERLLREPELYDLYREYQDEVKDIDPTRVNVLPALPANGDLVGPGDPAPGDPLFVPKKKLETLEKEKFQTMAKAVRQELQEERKRSRNQKRLEYYYRQKELRKMLRSNPQECESLVLKEQKEKGQAIGKEVTAKKVKLEAGNHVQFGDRMEIFGEDPTKGGKYKVIVKKIIKPNEDTSHKSRTVLFVPDLFKKVISKVDVSAAKQIKFVTTNKLTSSSEQSSASQEPQGESDNTDVVPTPMVHQQTFPNIENSLDLPVSDPGALGSRMSSAIEDETSQQGVDDELIYEDDTIYDDVDDQHRSGVEDAIEDVAQTEEMGPDHCYANRNVVEAVETPTVDPFVELQNQLRDMSEDEARTLVKAKMDGYKTVFKQQVTKLRQLLRARQKTNRKVKYITRILCTTLREQINKYYLQ